MGAAPPDETYKPELLDDLDTAIDLGESPQTQSLYNRRFFQVFAGVMLFMICTTLQFHFGQYIAYLGHGVDVLGWMLSITFIGTLAIRLSIGRWIDRTGCRTVWIIGTLVVAVAVGAIQFAQSLWLIVVLRSIAAMASASVMTTVAVFAAQVAPKDRRAEAIGTMGLAGFCGMIVGPALGDAIFAEPDVTDTAYHIFFTASAVAALLASGVIWFMPSEDIDTIVIPDKSRDGDDPSPTESQLQMIRRYFPGMVFMVGAVFATVWCFHSLYLERLAEARGFRDIKMFFLVYAPTAMILRLVFRRLPQQIGRTRTVFGGLLLTGVGMLFLIGVQSQTQLILPAILLGAGHCFVFPSMVDLCAGRFPPAYRGTGTSLILGSIDVGMLIGYMALGELIEATNFDVALKLLAAEIFIAALIYGFARRKVIFAQRVTIAPSLRAEIERIDRTAECDKNLENGP